MGVAIEFTESAGKHGYSYEDAIHAMLHAHYMESDFDDARLDGLPDPTLWIGPATSGRLIEVMTWQRPPDTVVIFHCMDARPKFLQRMRRNQE